MRSIRSATATATVVSIGAAVWPLSSAFVSWRRHLSAADVWQEETLDGGALKQPRFVAALWQATLIARLLLSLRMLMSL